MNQFSKELKMYAEGGLRTPEDWSGFGRDVHADSVCRVTVQHRGSELKLFSRDQTSVRPAKQRSA